MVFCDIWQSSTESFCPISGGKNNDRTEELYMSDDIHNYACLSLQKSITLNGMRGN